MIRHKSLGAMVKCENILEHTVICGCRSKEDAACERTRKKKQVKKSCCCAWELFIFIHSTCYESITWNISTVILLTSCLHQSDFCRSKNTTQFDSKSVSDVDDLQKTWARNVYNSVCKSFPVFCKILNHFRKVLKGSSPYPHPLICLFPLP